MQRCPYCNGQVSKCKVTVPLVLYKSYATSRDPSSKDNRAKGDPGTNSGQRNRVPRLPKSIHLIEFRTRPADNTLDIHRKSLPLINIPTFAHVLDERYGTSAVAHGVNDCSFDCRHRFYILIHNHFKRGVLQGLTEN